jgi:predicted RNA-binding Zn-ribbon protein involved in translation (DUF1610 family)
MDIPMLTTGTEQITRFMRWSCCSRCDWIASPKDRYDDGLCPRCGAEQRTIVGRWVYDDYLIGRWPFKERHTKYVRFIERSNTPVDSGLTQPPARK